jgi:putative salt-induced outer membrane protein YdiY
MLESKIAARASTYPGGPRRGAMPSPSHINSNPEAVFMINRLFRPSRSLILALSMLAVGSSLRAQDASEKSFVIDLGYVTTSGNTDVTTLNINQLYRFARMGWGIEETFGTIYGTDHGTVNTSLWQARLTGSRDLTERLSAVAGVGWDRNRFAGIDNRYEEFLGVRYKFVNSPWDQLYGEIAAALTQQDNRDGTSDDFPAARLTGGYKHNFSDAAYFEEVMEVIPNLEESKDYRVNNEMALIAPLSGALSLKLSWILRFDNRPPTDFSKTDTFFTAGLRLAF